jgi:hypothetical protein
MITKQEALRVAQKLGLQERKGKEQFFKLVHNGMTILTTAVPKGRGPLRVADKFRNQLRLNREQLNGAIKCPFKESDYREHLIAIGVIRDP